MSIVLVTADGPEHRFVANQIMAAHEVAAVFICAPPIKRKWHKVLRRDPVGFARKALRHIYLKAIRASAARNASLARVLGTASETFTHPELLVEVGRPKDELLAQKMAEIAPDIIAVYGTGIIPDEVLVKAGQVALNMHTGLSPDYRGTACAFWPILEGRPEMVGATVHECTSAVDGGRIYARTPATLYRGDDLGAVFARAVSVGAQDYVKVISDAIAGNLTGTPQDMSEGREFRGAMLGLGVEIEARRNLARMSSNWPPEP